MLNTASADSRRRFLQQLAFGTAALSTPGLLAEELTRTLRQTEGPFYPNKLPLDTDNDLLILNDALTPAVGEVTHLSGRVLGPTGEPINNAVVEIWQVDSEGVYIHTDDASRKPRDKNFQGYGRFLTGSKGEYYFRTIKPVPYTFRTPHIHFIVKKNGKRMLTTQCYIEGEKQNAEDPIYRRIEDAKARKSVTVDFRPIEDSRAGELAAKFDMVIGLTPEDPSEDRLRGGLRGRNRQQRGS